MKAGRRGERERGLREPASVMWRAASALLSPLLPNVGLLMQCKCESFHFHVRPRPRADDGSVRDATCKVTKRGRCRWTSGSQGRSQILSAEWQPACHPSASALNRRSVILFGGALISLRESTSEKRLSSNSAFHQLQSTRVWGELRLLCFLSKLGGKNAQTAVWVRFCVLHQLIPDWWWLRV